MDMSASDRSNGTSTPQLFSNDTGPTSPDGETSTSSPQLPTPTAGDSRSSGNRNLPGSGAHPGTSLTDVVREDRLLPTPNAGLTNYDESPETFDARRERIKEQGINGNGMGDSLGVAVQRVSTSSAEASPASQPPPPDAGRALMTTAGSGLSSPVWLASWDRDTSSWRTSQVSLLSTEDERFPRSWERWPTSGMTRRGEAFELPTLVPLIADSGSSSLPTPAARDSKGMGANGERADGREWSPGMEQLPTRIDALLHTPTTGDSQPNYDHRASPGYVRAKPVPNLHAQIDELLPTPVADHSRGLAQTGTDFQSLPNAVMALGGDPTEPPSPGGSE